MDGRLPVAAIRIRGGALVSLLSKQRLIDVDGGAIAVRLEGSGPPIVLVHGAGGDGRNWDRVVTRLADRHQCIVVDRAGFGASQWTTDRSPSRADHGRHLAAVVSAFGVGGCDAVGSSGGALAVIEALRTDGRVFGRAILIEPPLRVTGGDGGAGTEPSVAATGQAAPDSTPAAGESVPTEDPDELRARGVASVRRLDALAWDSLGDAEQQRYVASFATMFRETGQGLFQLTRDQLASVDLPVLVLYGSRSTGPLIAMAQGVAAALPAATLLELPEAAHLMYITHPDEVVARIDRFLAS
jgi:non-heme chloroperoxidase